MLPPLPLGCRDRSWSGRNWWQQSIGIRAWAVPSVHRNPVWTDTRSPQYTWARQGGMSASPNPAKGAGLEGCCQESPAATSHRCRHLGRLLLLESHCRGTRQRASSECPCPPLRDHCPLLGGQKEKARRKKKAHCKNQAESSWKIKPKENVSRSIFNPQPNMLAEGGNAKDLQTVPGMAGCGVCSGLHC